MEEVCHFNKNILKLPLLINNGYTRLGQIRKVRLKFFKTMNTLENMLTMKNRIHSDIINVMTGRQLSVENMNHTIKDLVH